MPLSFPYTPEGAIDVSLQHEKDHDTKLDEGGPNEVSAAQLKASLNAKKNRLNGVVTLSSSATANAAHWNKLVALSGYSLGVYPDSSGLYPDSIGKNFSVEGPGSVYDGLSSLWSLVIPAGEIWSFEIISDGVGGTRPVYAVGGGASKTGHQVFTGINSFSQPLTVAAATADGHAMRKDQVEAQYAPKRLVVTGSALSDGTGSKQTTLDFTLADFGIINNSGNLRSFFLDIKIFSSETLPRLSTKKYTARVLTRADNSIYVAAITPASEVYSGGGPQIGIVGLIQSGSFLRATVSNIRTDGIPLFFKMAAIVYDEG